MSSWKIDLELYMITFTYAIVLMYDLEIIDACLLLITTWSKLDAFLQNKLNAMT